MAYEADRVVVEILAETKNFDTTVKQSASAFDQSMNKIVASATKAEGATGKLSVGAKTFAAALQAAGGDLKKVSLGVEKTEVELNKFSLGAKKSEVGLDKFSKAAVQSAHRSQLLGSNIANIAAQLASGSNPFLTLARQGPQVANAMRLVSLGTGALGAVLGGIFITAALAAVAALYKMAFASNDTAGKVADLVEKLKKHAEQATLSARANEVWANSIDGMIERTRKLNEELEKQITTEQERLRSQLDQVRGQNTSANDEISRLESELEDAKRRLRERAAKFGIDPAEFAARRARDPSLNLYNLGPLADKVAQLAGEFNKAQIAAGETGEAVQNLNVLTARLKAEDIAEPIRARFRELRREAENTITNVDKLAKRLALLGEQEKEALKKAKKRSEESEISAFKRNVIGAEGTAKAATSSAQGFGGFIAGTWLKEFDKVYPQFKQMSDQAKLVLRDNKQVAEGIIDSYARANAAFLKGFGATVTSANLYLAHVLGAAGAKRVLQAAPGTPVGQVIDAKALAANAFLRKAGTAGGVRNEIARRIGASSADQGQGLEAITRANEEIARLAEHEASRRKAFERELEGLNQREIDARQSLIDSAEQIAALELMAIDDAAKSYAKQKLEEVASGSLRADEAELLTKNNNELAGLLKERVKKREDERKFRMQEQAFQNAQAFQTASLQDESALLQTQRDLAKTRKQRAALERRLLDLQFMQERAALEAIIAERDRLRLIKKQNDSELIAAEAAATRAQISLESLPERQANAQTSNDRQNRSPLDAYFGDIQAQADDMNTAFESVAAGGLATFTDALTDAIVNFTSLGDVGRAVLQNLTAALVKMAIQQIILSVVGKGAQTAATVATAAQMAVIGAAAAGPAALVSLATSGANAVGAQAGMASTAALAHLIGAPKAMGGRIYGPGTPTSDSVPIRASTDEFMIRASSAKRIGYGALEHLNRTGQMPGYASGGRIRSVSPVNMPAASPRDGGFSSSDINTLRGLIGEAVNAGIGAMPPVNLYASLDPADMLQRALGTPAGEKALIAALGRNSGRASAALGR